MSAAGDEWRELKLDGILGELGPLHAKREGDSWCYGQQTREVHGNPIGVIHGGWLMTLLDQTATLIATWVTSEKAVMTLQADTRFLSPARVGDFIEARARLRHRSNSTLFLDAELSVDGRPVADAALIMKIVNRDVRTPRESAES